MLNLLEPTPRNSLAGQLFSIFTSAFCYPDRRQTEGGRTADRREEEEHRGDKTRCSVTTVLLLVTIDVSGSEPPSCHLLEAARHPFSLFTGRASLPETSASDSVLQGKIAESSALLCKSLCPAAFPNRHELRQGSTAVKTLARIENPAIIIITKRISDASAAVRRAHTCDQPKIHPCIFLEATGSPRSWSRSRTTLHIGACTLPAVGVVAVWLDMAATVVIIGWHDAVARAVFENACAG
jgi:hypothetical protein